MSRPDRETLMDMALAEASKYDGNLTVRQLYYRLVAAGHIQSAQREYKRLVSGLSKYRLEGKFPFDWLEDRTRENRAGRFVANLVDVDRALDDAAHEISEFPYTLVGRARWWAQPRHVSVWVEKEALAGVFEEPCEDLGVSWLVCRGYASLSSLHSWVEDTAMAAQANPAIEEAVILYFGDHDPDGFGIHESAIERVRDINAIERMGMPPVTLERVALNLGQVREFDPPPFPAKRTSSRYQRYYDEHGINDCWELDALEPRVLDRMIRDSVDEHFDDEIYERNLDVVTDARDEFRERVKSREWLEEVLGG